MLYSLVGHIRVAELGIFVVCWDSPHLMLSAELCILQLIYFYYWLVDYVSLMFQSFAVCGCQHSTDMYPNCVYNNAPVL